MLTELSWGQGCKLIICWIICLDKLTKVCTVITASTVASSVGGTMYLWRCISPNISKNSRGKKKVKMWLHICSHLWYLHLVWELFLVMFIVPEWLKCILYWSPFKYSLPSKFLFPCQFLTAKTHLPSFILLDNLIPSYHKTLPPFLFFIFCLLSVSIEIYSFMKFCLHKCTKLVFLSNPPFPPLPFLLS